jgi:hypothetical protein
MVREFADHPVRLLRQGRAGQIPVRLRQPFLHANFHCVTSGSADLRKRDRLARLA